MSTNFHDIKPKPPEQENLKIKLDTSDLQNQVKPSPENYYYKLSLKSFDQFLKGVTAMWPTIKNFLVAKIVQWILKFGAGILVTLGISSKTIEEIVAGIVSLVAGIIYSLITHKKIALTNPQEFSKY